MANRFVLNETSYHGAGAIAEIATETRSRGFKKAFVCSDPDLVKFGVTQKVLDVLDKNGMAYELYSNIKPNPTIENVQTGVQAFKDAKTDYLIAIGGGSSMDTAKAIGIIINNPEHEDVISLEGAVDTKNKSVPIFAVPTTAGTAAEVTINYVITDAAKNRKMVCVDPHDIPVVAFIDPDMMSSMPKGLTAATGMDALTHAIEGYITAGAWELSDMFHLKAIEIISRSLRGAVENTPEKVWHLDSMLPVWDFLMLDLVLFTRWRILLVLYMIHRTELPMPLFCLPLWNTMQKQPVKNIVILQKQWALRARKICHRKNIAKRLLMP